MTATSEWTAVEGSETCIPMSEVIVQSKATEMQIAPTKAPTFPLTTEEREREPAAGEEEWMRNKVSQETYVPLLVKRQHGRQGDWQANKNS
jgi:hypothetical protein